MNVVVMVIDCVTWKKNDKKKKKRGRKKKRKNE